MRKQDRIQQQQSQDPSKQQSGQSQPRPAEQPKGTAAREQPNRPQGPPGKLPLPD
jgi:hypothetical protein